MDGEGKVADEDIGKEEQDLARASARSLPGCPTCALIQGMVRHRRFWLSVFKAKMVSLTN